MFDKYTNSLMLKDQYTFAERMPFAILKYSQLKKIFFANFAIKKLIPGSR